MGLILWTLFFCFATSAALLFQKFLLPLFPSLHGGIGLLEGDSLTFHKTAASLAEQINLHGWSSWRIFPAPPAAMGNVGLLAALYAIFSSNDPSLIIPFNAAAHAMGGILIFRIGLLIAPGHSGRMASISAAILFIVFPSALNWYGQLHKDGDAIVATLLLIYAWIRADSHTAGWPDAFWAWSATLISILVFAVIRPYNLILQLAVMSGLFVLALVQYSTAKCHSKNTMGIYAIILALLAAGSLLANNDGNGEQYSK